MSVINNCSRECFKGELDLFLLPETQCSVESAEYVYYKPIATIDTNSPIEFQIPASGDEYVDVGETFLYVVASITKEDSTALTNTDVVGPANNFLHTMFSDICVSMNGKLITPPSNLYPYKAYFEALFNYNETAKNSHQTLALWSKDTATKMDNSDDTNVGFKARSAYTALSKQVAMFGKLNVDIFGQSKYLMNNVNLTVTLSRSRNNFCLIGAAGTSAVVNIKAASLRVRRVKIAPQVLIAHTKILSKATAKYPITRVEMKNYTIPSGQSTVSLNNIILGQLPIRIIVGFTTNAAVNGSITLNPFNFQHFNLTYFSLTRDGVPVTSKPLLPVFTGDNIDYVESFYSTFSGTSIHTKDDGWGVTRTEYPDGYALSCFDLTPDQSASSTQWSLRKNGVIGLELRFSAALPSTLSCILYCEYQNLLEICADRRVTVDF